MSFQTQLIEDSVILPSPSPGLVPDVFSSCSRSALVFANDFMRHVDAPMLILHVVHEAVGEAGIYRRYIESGSSRPMEDIAIDMLDDFVDGVKSELTSADELDAARKIVVGGLPATRIDEIARREKAAFIIMGTHGRNGLSRLALGSVAEKVLQRSHIPVTIIKHQSEDSESPDAVLHDGGWLI